MADTIRGCCWEPIWLCPAAIPVPTLRLWWLSTSGA